MEQFEFVNKLEANEGRSGFANSICKLLYTQAGGNIDKAIKEGEDLFIGLEDHVRNIYELIDSEIPLIAYYELKKYGADNWGFDDSEYDKSINNSINACKNYYSY
tara:strand:+ start:11128 stop:11442 length:315 start_codon:yes stop_codon:yes gene_type:complete